MNMTMMRSVAVLVPVLMAAPALAQEQVTVVKRDGEKASDAGLEPPDRHRLRAREPGRPAQVPDA
ncbi:MAG: hypothetical protein R2712_18215 [Vicinamibacterales bacterium]